MCHRLLLISLLLLSGCSALTPERAALYGGGFYGQLKGPDLIGQIQGARVDINVNQALGLSERYGRVELGIDGYGGVVSSPEFGHIVGITPWLRYSYPLTDWLRPYAEGGAGPAILSFPTREQEKSGFTFNDQAGVGVIFQVHKNLSVIVGYRIGHFSHGGTRRTKNRGIEFSTGIVGLVFEFP